MFNIMNNVEYKNYTISTNELSKQTTEKAESNKSSNSQSGEGSSEGQSSDEASSGGSNTSEQEGTSNEEQNNKKFELKLNGVLTNVEDINWDYIKSEVENLYTSLPTITMNFYQSNINQQDILAFNKEYDNLTTTVKDNKKEETLAQLSKLYDYLPKFLKDSEQEEIETVLVETKSNIFKGYSKLDTGNWQEISNDIKNAINNYSNLLSKTDIEVTRQQRINKGYIMLNELQNATTINDESVFLIKYKNLLEEFNNI